MSSRPILKIALAAGLLAVAVTACGRRGALERPDAGPRAGGGAAVTARTLPNSIGLGGGAPEPDPAAVQAGDELAITAVPPAGTEAPIQTSRGARRGYRIPTEPFLLDPLL